MNPHLINARTGLTKSSLLKKPRLVAEKIQYYHTSRTTRCVEGERGCFLCSPEDLPNRNASFAYIIIKSTLKIMFFVQATETNKFLKLFCEAFFIFKKYYT
jgi:hypothetical protein